MLFVTLNRSKASFFVISLPVLKLSAIYQFYLHWWDFGFSDIGSHENNIPSMQNPSNIYVKLQFFNSNLLCNKKVPDGERKCPWYWNFRSRKTEVRDMEIRYWEKTIDWNQWKRPRDGEIVWDREKFEIKSVRDIESLLYMKVN